MRVVFLWGMLMLDADAGCWILDAGYWMLDTGYWILDDGGVIRVRQKFAALYVHETEIFRNYFFGTL